MRELKRNRRVSESAYSSALNEVRYDVEHDFKPLEGKGGIYVGLDDVRYDYDELSATVFVLDKNDKVIDEEIVYIPVDSMKYYTTREIRDMTNLMLEKINEVAENLRDSYDAYYSTKESKHLSRSRTRKFEAAIRSLNSLFKILKSHQDTSVAKNSSGMVWKGDVLYNRRNETEDGKIGDFISLGFSLSPDGKEMAIYETYSGKKKNIRFVEDFVPALRELGIGQSLIDYLCYGTGLSR